jgi:hypothetical protein
VAFGGGSSYWFADQLGTIFSFFIFYFGCMHP